MLFRSLRFKSLLSSLPTNLDRAIRVGGGIREWLRKASGVADALDSRQAANVELIPKADVYKKLKSASKAYNERTKSEHARKLLALIDPNRLFKTIEGAL